MRVLHTDTRTALLVHHVRADKRARLNAQVWQALASTERLQGGDEVAVVEVADDSDTTVVCSWRNWSALMGYVDRLERRIEELEGDDAA